MDDYHHHHHPKPMGLGPRGAVSLDGMLMVRKGRWTGRSTWKWHRRFCSFRFEHGGSLSVYKNHPEMATSVVKTVYSRLQRNLSMKDFRLHGGHGDNASSANHSSSTANNRDGESTGCTLDFEITADLPWVIKDIVSDPTTFVLEIDPGDDADYYGAIGGGGLEGMSVGTRERIFSEQDIFSDDGQPDGYSVDGMESSMGGDEHFAATDEIMEELENARAFGKALRIYFRCNSDTNEKGLWLKAFSSFGRLSRESRSKKSLLRSLTTGMHLGTSRVRNKANELLAKDTRHLDMTLQNEPPDAADAGDETNDVSCLVRGVTKTSNEKEFRVLPSYAYPHRWMTKAEMIEEMVLPSDLFHDLRVPDCKEKEIGSLKVEVLQCIGLPRLDRGSDSDAVVYMVCGSYAFSTDIIYSRTNPMWLRKARRACDFPLFHGYARLYVGVFDDEPRRVKDDFAGRVVLDLARLRPNSTYDVTLPLRLSTHVYSRRRRGAVRLRFTLNWKSERDALLTYVPKTLRIPLPQHSKPNYNTTVMCSDQKAFRNIAITVHGAHLPGRFTFNQLRAVIREINFTRKYIFSTLLRNVKEVRQWQNPAMSAFVFLSWMHCIYANAFSLVPAYTMLYLLLNLMQSYARYGLDGPSQRGFVPPSWEEMFMALLRGGDLRYRAISPLDYRPYRQGTNNPAETARQIRAYEPKGKKLLHALGFMSPQEDPDVDHVEFPFADGRLYPKFTIRECLANQGMLPDDDMDEGTKEQSGNSNHEQTPKAGTPATRTSSGSFNLDVGWMRKDTSGTKDYDAEESKFGTGRAVMTQGRRAASKLSSKTGIDYVVRTTQSGISSGVVHVSSGVKSSVKSIRQSARRNSLSSVKSIDNKSGTDSSAQMRESAPVRQQSSRSLFTEGGIPEVSEDEDEDENFHQTTRNETLIDSNGGSVVHHEDYVSGPSNSEGNDEKLCEAMETSQGTRSKEYPDQDIDVSGPSTGKKITDDLAEVRDKMHELTWHLFDDHTYIIKNPKAVFFNELKKGKIRSTNPVKDMDKYLHMGKYSHSNPFVARVGTYVEPIISSIYSILCLFRAGFNIYTWRDPFLTFLLSFVCGVTSIILFFFPWRIFLFVVGLVVVGPQNWAIRVLREQGHLPPAAKKTRVDDEVDLYDQFPTDKPLFTTESRKTGNDPRKPTDARVDPREVHHVVVPYGPLFYQRCNDWPPEPQYSKVIPNAVDQSQPRRRLGSRSDVRSVMSFDSKGLAHFRRKMLRRRANTASSTQSRRSQGSRLLRTRSSSEESYITK